MTTPFTYSVLQYRHSLVLGEAINVAILFQFQAAEKVVVGKAVNQRKEQRIRRHDQQDHNGRGQHSQTKPFGLGICGAEFGIYVSFHDSGLTFQKRYGS